VIDNIKEKYSVGALLYSPALNSGVAGRVISGEFGSRYSLALCLEDTISPDLVPRAENQVRETLERIYRASREQEMSVPRIFVRVREPEQAERVFDLISPFQDVFTGFVFPKYTVANAAFYNEAIRKVNDRAGRTVFMMPILESGDIVDFRTRAEMLGAIRDLTDSVKDLVLNVRVGGNDFSNEFAARRHADETIYDILPISQLLGDIITVFARDYVVSGPVWEYFAGANDEWKSGLERELRKDILNGFIGKTVIHPRQIPVVNEMLRVSVRDYEDARAILSWDESGLQVGKSSGGERMNEVRTNCNWAAKILLLAEIYGIRKEHVQA